VPIEGSALFRKNVSFDDYPCDDKHGNGDNYLRTKLNVSSKAAVSHCRYLPCVRCLFSLNTALAIPRIDAARGASFLKLLV
jgi:hypothetical protein